MAPAAANVAMLPAHMVLVELAMVMTGAGLQATTIVFELLPSGTGVPGLTVLLKAKQVIV
jgi:hypothetical protein